MVQKKSYSNQLKNTIEKKNEQPLFPYFLSLELENIRCFSENQLFDFSNKTGNPKQWTIILGDNGTGKTTLLQSLIAASYYRSGWLYKLNFFKDTLAIDCEKNSIAVKAFDRYIKITFAEEFPSSNPLPFFRELELEDEVFAYGASRKIGLTSISEQSKNNSFITLVDETALLLNPEEWLLQTDYASRRSSRFKEIRKSELELVKDILINVLPDVDSIRINEIEDFSRTPKPVVEVHTPYGWVEAKDLSLGYRTSMAWMVDFSSRMFDRYPQSENPLAEPAVVLIDEIDLHLHPKWQRELLDYLSNLFPNTQFIVTTHSPLIVQSAVARDANIVVCRRDGDHVVIDQSVEAVRNWRADQILTSDLFGLETARPKEIEPLLEEREKILSKAKLTKKDEKRLTELENEIGVMPVSENPEDDKAMDIIRRAAERLESQNK